MIRNIKKKKKILYIKGNARFGCPKRITLEDKKCLGEISGTI